MKVLVYSAKDFEVDNLKKANGERHKIKFVPEALDATTAVMAAGFTGLGLGATPVAIANMEAVTRHYGPSFKAFVVMPLIGAFFIDLLNAAVIKGFIGAISGWLG